MAHTTQDTALLLDSSGKEVKDKVLESEGGVVEGADMKHMEDGSSSTPSVAVADPHVEKTISENSSDTQASAPSLRPSLVPLGSSNPQGSGLTPTALHPKKFNTVNISKKFLERNSSTSTSATSSSNSSVAKSGSPVVRPTAQPASSHSRLVTTKLTANPVVSSAAAGWSRPSSVTPSPATATNSPSSTSPLPSTVPIQTSATAAPQLPHVGNVIQPQPRTAVPQPSLQQKDSASSKPVWRNVRPPNMAPIRSEAQASDFPTAAEVAGASLTARKQNKTDDAKAILDTATKQLRAEEADAFRGLHLGPNIHHWDEMEGDDDDFLGGVIEFGDGRQYKIESNDLPQETSSSLLSHSMAEGDLRDSPSLPITKEDRFVDDFDRSWPRSRNSPAEVARDFPLSASPTISPDISHPAQALQDSSRVLFNERSNRLEPYSQSHRPGQGPFSAKRAGYQEASGSEPRGVRDGPHNVQVLQKTIGGEFTPRSRRFSGGSAGFGPGISNGFTDRHRDRDHPNRRDGPSLSPRLSRDHQQPQADSGGRDWDFGSDRGRRTTMGPPPIPSYAQKHSQEEGRQLPSHLSQAPVNVRPRRISSRDSRFAPSEQPLSATLPSNSARFPPQSPSVSHASLVLVSPISGQNIALPLNAPELDEARKDVMQSAAARAKQRRQQEEEEREAQKERARKKAVELEEKMKTAEADKAKQKEAEEAAMAKEKEAVAIIEDVVNASTKPLEDSQSDSTKPLLRRPPSLKSVPRQTITERSTGSRRTSILSPRSAPLSAPIPLVSATSPATSPASQIDSWRVKTNPPPQQQIQSRPSTTPAFIAPPPSALEQVESIADGAQDDLEVVDFSDMGKFVGATEIAEAISYPSPVVKINTGVVSRPVRPVASDFFDEPDPSGNTAKEGGFGVWRKGSQGSIAPLDVKADVSSQAVLLNDSDKSNEDQNIFPDGSFFTDTTSTTSMTSTKEPLSHVDHEHGGQTINVPPNLNSQRTPRNQGFYKEAAMSALDDAMSRIKGALVGMQVNEVPKDLSQTGLDQESRAPSTSAPPQAPPKERWVPPALRPRNSDHGDEAREEFLVTAVEPPTVVPPTGSSLAVRLPSVLRPPMEGISKKQLQLFSKPPFQFRMDILSFDPPVQDMSRRDLSINDVLFRIPQMSFKGRFRYRVSLPRSRGPKVHIPTSNLGKSPGVGAFGRPTISDGATTWRKSTSSPTKVEENTSLVIGLSTMSRSPPPQNSPVEASFTSMPKLNEDLSTKADSTHTPVRSRSQPKMPIGSAVAFYRDSRIDVIEAVPKPLVNFIVGSELEDIERTPEAPIQGGMDIIAFAASSNDMEASSRSSQPTVNGVTSSPSTSLEQSLPSLVSKTESKSSDDCTDPILITPPHHHAVSWARSSVSLPIKDSPARAPDPEHLKAVWSQTSNKAGLHPVNSLEGIADDLTALPFTLQDVKSEDGETPPPSLSTAPSRMSLHEVTRAFQQVPTSSSSSTPPSHRTAISPPLTNAPVARPTYSYSPLPQNNMRQAYASYPSPMMNHSPAPAMYPHPMAHSPAPGRMPVNGHTPLYSQPMWVTVAGPTPQGHGTMMRPVASPYPGPMMYPSPGYVPQPALPAIMPTVTHTQNGNRGRGGPVMSPGISHSHAHSPAMYGGSPVLLHAMQVPQNHGFMPMPAGRGQPRTDNGQNQHPPHNHHPSSHTGFSSGANNSFVRSAW